MAEILIKATLATTFEVGDIVDVQQDGFNWGTCECLPNFLVIKIDGTVEDNIGLLDAITAVNADGNVEVVHKRKYNLNYLQHMTAPDLSEIKNTDWLVRKMDKSLVQEKIWQP